MTVADAARLDPIRAMFRRFGFDPDDADARARKVYLTPTGYFSMQLSDDMATRLLRVPGYVKAFTGTSPKENDLARFHARLKSEPAGPTIA